MQRRDLNASDAPAPAAAYTHAIEVSGATRTLYISGQVGVRMDGTIPDDITEQSRLAWQNLAAQLRAAGMTVDSGSYLSTSRRVNGKWLYVRDIYNSDRPLPTPASAAAK